LISLWNGRSASPSALISLVEKLLNLVNQISYLIDFESGRHKGFYVLCEANVSKNLPPQSVPNPAKRVPMLALCSPQKSLFIAGDFVSERSFRPVPSYLEAPVACWIKTYFVATQPCRFFKQSALSNPGS